MIPQVNTLDFILFEKRLAWFSQNGRVEIIDILAEGSEAKAANNVGLQNAGGRAHG